MALHWRSRARHFLLTWYAVLWRTVAEMRGHQKRNTAEYRQRHWTRPRAGSLISTMMGERSTVR